MSKHSELCTAHNSTLFFEAQQAANSPQKEMKLTAAPNPMTTTCPDHDHRSHSTYKWILHATNAICRADANGRWLRNALRDTVIH